MQGLLSWISLFRCKSAERLFYKQLTDLRYVIVQRFLGPCTLIADFFEKTKCLLRLPKLDKSKTVCKTVFKFEFCLFFTVH